MPYLLPECPQLARLADYQDAALGVGDAASPGHSVSLADLQSLASTSSLEHRGQTAEALLHNRRTLHNLADALTGALPLQVRNHLRRLWQISCMGHWQAKLANKAQLRPQESGSQS